MGLVLVKVTGATWIDPAAALMVAGAIVFAGVRILHRTGRVLVDEALPEEEPRRCARAISTMEPSSSWAFTSRVPAVRGAGATSTSTSSSATARACAAHTRSRTSYSAIADRLRGTDVLIHLEPEESAERRGSD